MKTELLKIIKLQDIAESPWQGRLFDTETRGRFNPDATRVKQLADSIEKNGLMQPITVREVDGKYELVDGHRRVEAYKLLGLGNIKALVKPYSDREAQLFSIIGNLQRSNLNPIEQAVAFRKVLGSGLFKDKKELSAALGKDETYVGDVLNTLNMDDRIVNDLARTGAVQDVRLLRMIRRVEPADKNQTSYKQWALYQQVVKEKLNRKQLAELIRQNKAREKKKDPTPWILTQGRTTWQVKLKTGKLSPEKQAQLQALLNEKLGECMAVIG